MSVERHDSAPLLSVELCRCQSVWSPSAELLLLVLPPPASLLPLLVLRSVMLARRFFPLSYTSHGMWYHAFFELAFAGAELPELFDPKWRGACVRRWVALCLLRRKLDTDATTLLRQCSSRTVAAREQRFGPALQRAFANQFDDPSLSSSQTTSRNRDLTI